MKKKIFSALIALGLSAGLEAQLFIRDYAITPASIQHDRPVDVNYHGAAPARYLSLHHSPNGNIPVLEYDAATYNSMPGANLFKPGANFQPVSMVHNGNFTAVLFNMPAIQGYGIAVYNHNTNALLWAKSVTYPSPAYGITVTDIAVDPAGTYLYVLGNITNNSTGESDIYISKLSAVNGFLTWHRRINDPLYDFDANNIHFYSNNEIYLAVGAFDPNSILNRGALVVMINNNGIIQSHTLIKYDTPCIPNRLTAPSVNRLNNDVYVFCPSVVGADGSGDYFLAKLTSNLSAITMYNVYFANAFYFYGYRAPEFEFVNNNANIMISGIRSILNSATDGYLHSLYDLNTNFISANTFQNTNVSAFGSAIYDAYNPVSDKVFSVAENPVTPNRYYAIKTLSNGDLSPGLPSSKCDTPYTQKPDPCKVVTYTTTLIPFSIHGASKPIKFLFVLGANQTYTETCIFNCAGCREIQQDEAAVAEEPQDVSESRLSGITSLSELDEFNLYPNPASSSLNVSHNAEIRQVEIININGVVVKTVAVSNSKQAAVDVSELSDGVYFVKITTAANESRMKKFIKN